MNINNDTLGNWNHNPGPADFIGAVVGNLLCILATKTNALPWNVETLGRLRILDSELEWKCLKINYMRNSSSLLVGVYTQANAKIWLNLSPRETTSGDDTSYTVATDD